MQFEALKVRKVSLKFAFFCNLETRTNIDFRNDTTFVARILMYVQNELYAGKKNEKLLGLLGEIIISKFSFLGGSWNLGVKIR